jgi:hypothetical protein
MNTVEIEEATIKRLRAGASNKSDPGGVLQISAETTVEELNACHKAGPKNNRQNDIRSKESDGAWDHPYRPQAV